MAAEGDSRDGVPPVAADGSVAPRVAVPYSRQRDEGEGAPVAALADREIALAKGAGRATMQQTRGRVLQLLWELEMPQLDVRGEGEGEGAAALGGALLGSLLDAVESVDDAFPKWWLPNTPGARGHLRCWQALSVLARHLAALPADVRSRAGCSWGLLRGRQLAEVRPYMERVAVEHVLASPADAPAALAAALGQFDLKRDPASSIVLVARHALLRPEALPAGVRYDTCVACVPLLLGWATCNFHTARMVAQLTLVALHEQLPALRDAFPATFGQ
eukprot:4079393-Prymnesium_polylepis.1